MVQLELSYLHDIGRLAVGGADIISDLGRRTLDPFDRLIVADALVAGTSFVTKDRAIHDRTSVALW